MAKPVRKASSARSSKKVDDSYEKLVSELFELLSESRRTAARAVSSVMTRAYWLVGQRIVEHEQHGKRRAAYGEALLAQLGDDLTTRLGRGFSERNLRQMRAFYLAWPLRQTLSAEVAAGSSETESGKIRQTTSANRTS